PAPPPQLAPPVRRQVAEVHNLHLPVGVLVHRERVDHPDRAALLQPLQLRDDLTVKIRIPESEHNQLDRSYRHGLFLSSTPRSTGSAATPCKSVGTKASRPSPRAASPATGDTTAGREQLLEGPR